MDNEKSKYEYRGIPVPQIIGYDEFYPSEARAKVNDKPDKAYQTRSKKGRKGVNIPSQDKRENPMANKFLPFIVEKSSPINIYQTLLSRSKGMNTNLVTTVFNIVMHYGILEVREYVKTLDDMFVEQLYQNIVEHYPNSKIDDEILTNVLSIEPYLDGEHEELWVEELDQFVAKDVLCFLLVMVIHSKIEEYTNLDIHSLTSYTAVSAVLNTLPAHVKFSDSGQGLVFNSKEDLKGFILYRAFMYNPGHKNEAQSVYRAVFKQESNNEASR